MSVKKAYNQWAKSYDEMANKTRDLEAIALRDLLAFKKFENVMEIGCGTGKNTEWFAKNAQNVTAVDLSDEMLEKAKLKIDSKNVYFQQADITQNWHFAQNDSYDLVSFSLVLEHIKNLGPIFKKSAEKLKKGGYLYLGELHPFKQYNGTKARFETENGTEIVECYDHHISDFVEAGLSNNLEIISLKEYFDEVDRSGLPRILAVLMRRK